MARKLGEVLQEQGLITGEQLDEALKTQVIYGGRLGTLLVQRGFLRIDDLGRCLSIQHGLPHAEKEPLEAVTNAARAVISREQAARYNIVPMAVEGSTLHLAMADPIRSVAGELSYELGLDIRRYVSPELRIKYYLERYYGISRSSKFLRQPEGFRVEKPSDGLASVEPPRPRRGTGAEERRTYLSPTLDWDLDATPIEDEEELQESMGIVTLEEYHRLQSDQHPPVEAGPQAASDPAPGPAPEPPPLPEPPLPPAEVPDVALEPDEPTARLPKVLMEVTSAVSARSPLDLVLLKLESANTGQEVGQLAVEPFMDCAVTSVLFWVRDGLATAGHARGVCVADPDLRRLVVSLEARSVLQYAHDQQVLVHGLGEGDPVHAGVAQRLGVPVSEEVSIASLMVHDQVIALLYITSGPRQGFPHGAQAQLMTLARGASKALLRLVSTTAL